MADPDARRSRRPGALLPVATLVVLAKYSIDGGSPQVTLIGFFGVASWAQYHPAPCIRHVYWGGTPMYGVLALLLTQAVRLMSPRWAGAIAIGLLVMISAPEVALRLVRGPVQWREQDTHIQEPIVLSGLRLAPSEAAFHSYLSGSMARLASEWPDSNIVTTGSDALYLTYNERVRNIGNLYLNMGGRVASSVDGTLLGYIASTKPIVISEILSLKTVQLLGGRHCA